MKQVALIAALLLVATPAGAQVATSSESQNVGTSSQGTAGVICEDEMAGTFCNVVTSPSNGGYGASNGSGGTAGSTAVPTPTPPCGEFPPPNELCN